MCVERFMAIMREQTGSSGDLDGDDGGDEDGDGESDSGHAATMDMVSST